MFQLGPQYFDMGRVETLFYDLFFRLLNSPKLTLTNYFQAVTSRLSCDSKEIESFRFILIFCLQSYKEKMFQSPLRLNFLYGESRDGNTHIKLYILGTAKSEDSTFTK